MSTVAPAARPTPHRSSMSTFGRQIGAFTFKACATCFNLVQDGRHQLIECARGHSMIVPPDAGSPKFCPLHKDVLA